MPRSTRTVLRQIDTLFNVGNLASLTDGQLLERFGTRQGEASELAFAAIVERHGPMVLRVCRAFSTDPHDAQDAFQATFLVLVRKARSLWVNESLAPWLYAVAQRIARHLRADAARRRRFETEAAAQTSESYEPGLPDPDAQAIHEELARLPEAFRAAIVLCDLAGQTHDQAARTLGVPSGTVKSRLARGRAKLRFRLARRGWACAGLATGVLTGLDAASASVPAALAESTVIAAARVASVGLLRAAAGVVPMPVIGLAQEGLSTMLGIKLKVVGLTLGLATIVATGAAGLAVQETAKSGSAGRAAGYGTGSAPATAIDDARAIQGTWTVCGLGDFGPNSNLPALAALLAERSDVVRIGPDTIDIEVANLHGRYRLNAPDPQPVPAGLSGEDGRVLVGADAKRLPTIDILENDGKTTPGIYELRGNTLSICLGVPHKDGPVTRPAGFEESDLAPGTAARVYVLARAQEAKADGRKEPDKGSDQASVASKPRVSAEDLARQLKRLEDENAALRDRLEQALKAQADAAAQAEQARRAEQVSRDRAVRNEALARAEADKAAEVAKHLQLELLGTLDGGSPEEKHAWSLLKRGLEEQKVGRLSPAEDFYERAREVAEESVKRQPDAVAPRALLARSMDLQGSLKLQQGNTDQAGALFRQALEIERTLIEKAPSNPDLREQFAGSLTRLGTLLQKIGRLEQARAELERSRAVVEQLVRETPTRPSSRAALADVLDELGQLAQSSGRAAEAKDLRLKASAIRERLLQESQGEPTTPAAEPKAENRPTESNDADQRIRQQVDRLDQLRAENDKLRFLQNPLAGTTRSVIPWVHRFVPLPQGETSESLSNFAARVAREAVEGWEFTGTADVRLTPSEYEALAKGDVPPKAPNEDVPGSVYRVYIFRRPIADANALAR